MKKVVRIVWIGALSGIAFLAACCTTKGGLTRAERKHLTKERDSIQEILNKREMAVVYGSPEIIANYKAESYRLQYELDSLNHRLGQDIDMEKSKTRWQLQQRLVELKTTLQHRESACIYGSPEVMERYREKNNSIRQEIMEVEKQLEELGE